ncbi:fibroleukin-like [Saccostrea echinata]|uniref:fibroleukin-like n=1 Tax=Saccostrea echinata TaxID=191078 RepID=UPI002A819E1C|nr:fibroleukin-like [Saccostrea echinata]
MSSFSVICLFVALFTASQATEISRGYSAKLEFDDVKSSNELLGEHKAQSLCACSAMCQKNCGLFGYNPNLMSCRTHKKIFTSEMSNETGWRYYSHHFSPFDCKDLLENGQTSSGVYAIYPYGTGSLPVNAYCDMEIEGGGWTAIQKRVDGSIRFDRNWTEYKNGFGDPERDVWIGNDVIHQLTRGKNSSLYVSIKLSQGGYRQLYELYERFSISNESEKYKLFLGGNATGTLGESMINTGNPYHNLSGMYFTTLDSDNDEWSAGNCASGGWWFNSCHLAFLNGFWRFKGWQYPWYPHVNDGRYVTETMMLIKRH